MLTQPASVTLPINKLSVEDNENKNVVFEIIDVLTAENIEVVNHLLEAFYFQKKFDI